MPDPWEYTVADRVLAAAAGVVLGLLVAAVPLASGSALAWLAVPVVLGIAGAAFGWRPLELVMRAIWWWF